MKLVVQDACILFDLLDSGLWHHWSKLGIETVTTDLVVNEITDPTQKGLFDSFRDQGGITVIQLAEEQLAEVVLINTELSGGISLPDSSVLYLAIEKKAALLTGDSALKKKALQKNIQVRGILWVLDTLVSKNIIASSTAKNKLKDLINAGCRLPPEECNKRLNMW